MTSIAISLAYLGTLAAGCWAWWQVRRNPPLASELGSLKARAKAWDEAAGDLDTIRIAVGLKPKDRK